MAAKKPASKTKAAEVAPAAKAPVVEPRSTSVPAGGIAISEKDAAVLSQPIDARMKALLKDHKEMGAR